VDLHDFNNSKMYFDEELPEETAMLLEMAASNYANNSTECLLLKAYFQQPESLTVIVALYRYYFYQHKLKDAMTAANAAMQVAAKRIELHESWQQLTVKKIGYAAMRSMEMLRFYLLALKGAGYLNLRMGAHKEGIRMLEKVLELDHKDRLGAKALLAAASTDSQDVDQEVQTLR